MIFAVLLFAVAGFASAAPYHCPPPSSAATVACTFASIGGTTTYVVSVSASASGSAQAGAGIAVFVTVDGQQCNNDYGVKVPVVDPNTSVTVEGGCTFDVPSTRLVNLIATAQSQNASPVSISLTATSIAFVPDVILTVFTTGYGSVTSSDARIDCGFDCYESYLPNSTVRLFANPIQGWLFSHWSGGCSGTSISCLVTMDKAKSVTANFSFASTPPVVEFHNSILDHYFITADPLEATAVDNGSAGPGWSRTGLTFNPGGDVPVCRFYGSIAPGPNSHFYTAFPAECYTLQQLAIQTPASQPKWNFEGIAFGTTEPLNGGCAPGLVPVYRAYNDGAARGTESNHRFSTSLSAINEVVARGWKSEGVVMCALP